MHTTTQNFEIIEIETEIVWKINNQGPWSRVDTDVQKAIFTETKLKPTTFQNIYGVYSVIKQNAFEGGISRALICINFQL